MRGRSYSEEDKENIYKMIEWINLQDVFWLAKLRIFMNCNDSEGHINDMISNLIRKLKNMNYLQCTEVRNGQRQYILIKKIEIIDVNIGK